MAYASTVSLPEPGPVTVTLRDARHSPDDRTWIAAVYQEYVDELAQNAADNTGIFPMQGEHGSREGELLARWFRDDRSHPLVLLHGGKPAGFALVARPLQAPTPGAPPSYEMAEFFVRPQFRRLGVGRSAALLIFARFAGDWRVNEARRNVPAVAFWRRVIAAYTGGAYTERQVDGDIRHTFRSTSRS